MMAEDKNQSKNVYLLRQGGKLDYNYKEFFVDNKQAINDIDITFEKPCPGSIVYVIDTGAIYILNSQKEWVEQGEE